MQDASSVKETNWKRSFLELAEFYIIFPNIISFLANNRNRYLLDK